MQSGQQTQGSALECRVEGQLRACVEDTWKRCEGHGSTHALDASTRPESTDVHTSVVSGLSFLRTSAKRGFSNRGTQ